MVAVSLGDGAFNQGSTHEGLAFAAARSLPVLIICENNGWSELTPTSETYQSRAHRATGLRLWHARCHHRRNRSACRPRDRQRGRERARRAKARLDRVPCSPLMGPLQPRYRALSIQRRRDQTQTSATRSPPLFELLTAGVARPERHLDSRTRLRRQSPRWMSRD